MDELTADAEQACICLVIFDHIRDIDSVNFQEVERDRCVLSKYDSPNVDSKNSDNCNFHMDKDDVSCESTCGAAAMDGPENFLHRYCMRRARLNGYSSI